VKEIFRREPENWLGSDDEDSEGDEGSDGDDEEEDDAEDEEGDAIMVDTPIYEDSPRKSRRNKNAIDDGSEGVSTAPSLVADEESEAATSTVDDSLPYPRPFESRRDFFQRTSNEWQEVLMQSLRLKGIQPETLSVKEIKTKAFDMSEEKWWDCREEIIALEDEQEEAGIGEVVTLADRGEAGAIGRRR
jgi:hypothetical protein